MDGWGSFHGKGLRLDRVQQWTFSLASGFENYCWCARWVSPQMPAGLQMKSLIAIALCASSLHAAPATWPQFRGPNASGVAEGKPPVHFNSETNLAWKTPIPSGLSSPCAAGDRIFITATDADKLIALCFDARTGKELWRREAPPGKAMDVHRISSPAVATPAADNSRVYFYFAPYGVVAYEFDGTEKWRTPVPVEFVMNGSGTSPIIHDGAVIVNCDQDDGESYLIALDAYTGQKRWRTSRAGFPGSYSTPAIWKRGSEREVVVAGSQRVVGYDFATGEERWSAAVLTAITVSATPAIGGDMLFLMSRGAPANAMGTFESFASKNDKDSDGKVAKAEMPKELLEGGFFRGIDRDKDGFITDKDWSAMTNFFTMGDSGLFALRAPGRGDVTKTHVAWKQTKGVAHYASPLFYRDRVYVVQDGGRLSCWDAKTGKVIYEQERVGADGEYYASPVAANGHVYVASTRGTVSAVRAGDTFEVASRNVVGDRIMATPAIAGDTIIVRSAKHLWAFGAR
jgi:outer membrane protein assembly factor BamB